MASYKAPVDVHKLIAAVVPEPFCDLKARSRVKSIVKEGLSKGNKNVYLDAAKEAEPAEYKFIDFLDMKYGRAFDLIGFERPIEKHKLEYDSFGEGLEHIYFWLLDRMEYENMDVERLIDTFESSAGSGHFSEMGLKSARMQEEGMKMLGAANQVVKSIIQIIYDLKDFKLRLKIYADYRGKDNEKKHAAILSLKQIWMDTVDMKRGNSSIYGLTRQFDYVTLIDAFMAAPNLKAVKDMDLNDRVKRILEQRVLEFYNWLDESEKELTKRFEIEKEYLRSQVNTVKLYARWAKPYLTAARQLTQSEKPYASLVTTFNSTVAEVLLFAKTKYKPADDILEGNLPSMFNDVKKKFNQVTVIEFTFRSSPEKAGQGYGFRGKVNVEFTSYALTDDEIKIVKNNLERDNLKDLLDLIEGATDNSLGKLANDLDEFLKEDPFSVKGDFSSEDTNPFSALFSIFTPEKKPEKKEDENADPKIKSDTEDEKVLRSLAILDSRKRCWRFYDLYKKAHNMPSLPGYA